MRERLGVLILVTATAGASLLAQNQIIQDSQLFRSGIELTSVVATVRDAEGRLVTGLAKDVFEVYEDGELQKVAQFTAERVPISLGVLLDTSDSMFGQRIKDARAAVEHFLFDLLDERDEYFVMSFNHQPHAMTGWTSSPDVMRRALDRLRPWGGTAAYDAVAASLPMFVRRSRLRAGLLIISDGADTASDMSLRELRRMLVRSDTSAYAIAMDSPERQAINTRVNPTALREITDDSGGRTEVVHSSTELEAATARIAEELNSQYLLGYTSPHSGDGQYHSIRVRIRETGYKVRARNGFVATPSSKS
jgi:Ca-activated chloride channel homolog